MFDNIFKNLRGKKKAPSSRKLDHEHDTGTWNNWKAGDVLLERYRVDKVFSGAMGRVYIAEHLAWKVPLAIKAPKPEIIADQEGLKRIITEANSWVRMGMHPNVATCYYVLNIDDIPYLFIEYVDGGDLSSWLKTGRCADQRTSLNLAVQFCHGMEFTHSKGIIHRDIKPGNILLTKNSLLKITDFGIVQTVKSDEIDQSLPQISSEDTVGFRGTPSYASPEQFRDTHSVDLRSDIFSFGIVLWLMFCGRRPFKNNAKPENAVPTPTDPKSPFPTPLKELLIKCVAFEAQDRYQTFAELRQALNDIHTTLFRVPCPFMELDFADLQAENLNNRAISLLELGRRTEGEKCLQRALDENDSLPEALFNFTLLKWQDGKDINQLHRQAESFRKRFPQTAMLDTLAQAIRCDLHKNTWTIPAAEKDPEAPPPPPAQTFFPEYLLCFPKNSTDIFQTSQLSKAAKINMADLLQKKRYQECKEMLLRVWENKNFKKDADFQAIYENLLAVGSPKNLKAVLRLQTLRSNKTAARTIMCRPGKHIFFTLDTAGKLLVHRPTSAKTYKPTALGNYTSVREAALSPDKSILALALDDGKIDCICLDTGKIKAHFINSSPVTAIAISHSNATVATGSATGNITLFNLNNRKETHLLGAEGIAITALDCFNRSDDFISASEDGTIRFWAANEDEPIRIVQGHAKEIQTISSSANNRYFVSGSKDRLMKIWDRQTGQCNKTVSAGEPIRATLVSANSDYIFSAGDSDIISVCKPQADKPDFLLDGRGDGITTLAAGSHSHIFLAGCQDGSIIYWMLVYDLEFS